MLFRFASGLALVVIISLVGAALDKETLALRRGISRQQFQLDVLVEQHARLRTQAQTLGTPARWLQELETGKLPLTRTLEAHRPRRSSSPLLNWTGRPETAETFLR